MYIYIYIHTIYKAVIGYMLVHLCSYKVIITVTHTHFDRNPYEQSSAMEWEEGLGTLLIFSHDQGASALTG